VTGQPAPAPDPLTPRTIVNRVGTLEQDTSPQALRLFLRHDPDDTWLPRTWIGTVMTSLDEPRRPHRQLTELVLRYLKSQKGGDLFVVEQVR
jgi:hypothetical protein